MTNATVNPSEVGWQFVPQYYTFVNKQPNRLHCFYTKASTFIHGTEGEDGKPCYGQQEIHAKITSIGFQDCKVFIHSVDAQSSANGGIIIQVIGEMSNRGEPWRKFVQTFFLAEQPNGYFVLNDIFRFLKEETVDDEPSEEAEVPVADALALQEPVPPAAPATPTPAPVLAIEPTPESPAPTPASVSAPAPAEEIEVPSAPESVPEQQTNGVHEPDAEPIPEPAAETPSQPAPEPTATASPPPVSPPASPHQQLPPSPAPIVQQLQPAQPPASNTPAQPPAAPIPTTPAAPKTWANLAAAGRNKWGSAVAQDVRGVSEAPVSSSSPAPTSTPQSPAPHARPQGQQNPAHAAAMSVATAQCFVKGVIEPVSEAALRNVLTQRFGPIKEMEIVRNKACAFIEFISVDAARRAIVASLSPNQGGEGGIRIGDGSDGAPARILVETRKERGERPPPRGGPMNGDRGRGGYRGGRGGPGGPRGRGGAPQK